jgi:VWFA-related protein
MRYCVLVLGFAVVPVFLYSQEQPLPRFRAGANLVRADVYVSKNGAAVTDLKPEDFVVYEDDKPQSVESFELIRARGPNPESERTNPTTVRDMRQEMQDSARVFTLFFDRMHVQLDGSFHARQPIIETLNKVIGPDDLVGAMTPDMAPTQVTYSRRTGTIGSFLTETWHWGERMRVPTIANTDPAIRGCLWAIDDTVIRQKYNEQQTLLALTSLVDYLDGLRPERKFVMVFTEGWPLFPSDSSMSSNAPPPPEKPGVDPRTGVLRKPQATEPGTEYRSDGDCDRIQSMLSTQDHRRDFQTLLQRANRANVSFYPIDTRGLIVCDMPGCPAGLAADLPRLNHRRNSMYDMAAQTDGQAVLDAGDVGKAMQRVFADVGSYYLLGYYSTNQKLDGRFRRIRVEVKRPDTDVRARPGYLAPTEAEARAASVSVDKAVAARAAMPPTVSRALDALAPTRGSLPARIQAAGGAGTISAIVELDAATMKQSEWMTGGTLRMSFDPETAGAEKPPLLTLAIEPGQRSVTIDRPGEPLPAGRYTVRAELAPRGSRAGTQVSTPVDVLAADTAIGSGALAYRRGPSTGLAYVPTADARFRRTERLRVEVPIAGEGVVATGRLLTRDGQPMPLTVMYQARRDETSGRSFGQAEVVLSPLAAGEYVLELTFTAGGVNYPVGYGFRIIP